MSIAKRVSRFDAHQRLYLALGVALLTALVVMPTTYQTPVKLTLIWIGYACTVLGLMWTSILVAHPRDLPRLSRLQDSSRTFIFAFVVVAAVASLFAVVALLDSMKPAERAAHSTLAVLAVFSAWALVHTVFIMRYAHLYYGNDPRQTHWPGGLDFPHEPEPDYLDFAYFSFVIGMTSQVSDVAIGSKAMRRTALIHGVLSFGFNTTIIALTISGLAPLL